MFWQKDIETMPRQELEKLQLKKLQWVVKHCYDNVKFYHDRLDQAGVNPDKIKALSDLQYIPYTTKDDIRDHYPYGLFAVPMKKVVRIHASSGTTGKPTVVGYTRQDLKNWADMVTRFCVSVGVTDEDVAQISFGYGLFTGALGLHYGLENMGVAVVPASSGNTEKQIMLLKDFGVTTIISTPSYALYMAEVAREMGYTKEDFKLRIGLFGSEGSTVEMREQIEAAWGLFATDNYGMSELVGPGVSGECHVREGLHFAEDHFLPEIIDAQSGDVLPRGETGELVVTTLSKEAIPLLRYRTKDITRLNYEVCPCGRTHVRMDKVTGRTDDMLKIRGVNVFPSQVESVLLLFPQISPNYQLVLRREDFTDTMEIRVEPTDGSLLEIYSELEKLQQSIRFKMRTVLGIDVKVSLVEPKSMERFAGKARRIVDLRNQKEDPKF
ncbi:phenylacetate--CoA ligase [Clostridiaceae bacterium NSJ-31]|uniref:Phenylacetate-coenzyme A ligase n=1 Tax=Ligaoa zhengdingensis TaxID=2763658 RepID=A0A926HZ23_9FIRM|nr:phenylacetate--CoA ligase [Ligaoa zhengdingensis]MBC8545462.1 phenylacetate--CoA ligase [Ligaoa zhengdingensis]